MKIKQIYIQNFRKLKSCVFDLDENQTICVGANNSGKTSFMDAVIEFLSPDGSKKFKTRDFTLDVWDGINAIGESWMKEEVPESDRSIKRWENLLPTLDIWFEAEEKEAYLVRDLIPSLDWDGGLVGARVRFEPKLEELFEAYTSARGNVLMVKKTERGKKHIKNDIYPKHLWDFLDRNNKLQTFFTHRYYVLDPDKIGDLLQLTPDKQQENILKGLIKIDYIEAQRGFSDPNSSQPTGFDTLSRQLSNYYDSNGDPVENLTEAELPLYEEIVNLTESLNKQLDEQFKKPVSELKQINYPGFQNPSIKMNTRVNPKETLQHESSVLFEVGNKKHSYELAEQYNGLGYRNLISMYFQLIHFRESWINGSKKEPIKEVEPVHLVLIEEPEAHLHAQAQQVFIAKAYFALTNNEDAKKLHTQLVVSTHSTHIAHEVDFNCLRYFKRQLDSETDLPVSTIINLTNTFGKDDKENERFVTRYIKLTHCDMFFADGIIIVEGAGERILMPKFLEDAKMDNMYLSLIEINGAHAHRFRPLVEKIGMPTLIITDLDAQVKNGTKARPERGKGYITNNDTLKKWLPCEDDLDKLIDLDENKKQNGNLRVAYQYEIRMQYKGKNVKVIPYTLEDAIGLTNIELFDKETKGVGMVKKFHNAVQKDDIEECQTEMFNALNSSKKAEFAIDLLLSDKFESLQAPEYIIKGLDWLKGQISTTKDNAIE